MRLADVEIEVFISALRKERSEWIAIASEEKRKSTEAEHVIICMLHALERVLKHSNTPERGA